MVDFKTVLEVIEAKSLIYQPPISTVWETFKIGVNLTQITDCLENNETCFNERIKNGNANVENAVIVATHINAVSIILKSNL